mmetsp:Transcript_23650/g.64133  ORF Transcript_23650/g.64133 Transcript_23650/m.64133 type:complete len:203 (-) Transcript_23650:682-1290(-)
MWTCSMTGTGARLNSSEWPPARPRSTIQTCPSRRPRLAVRRARQAPHSPHPPSLGIPWLQPPRRPPSLWQRVLDSTWQRPSSAPPRPRLRPHSRPKALARGRPRLALCPRSPHQRLRCQTTLPLPSSEHTQLQLRSRRALALALARPAPPAQGRRRCLAPRRLPWASWCPPLRTPLDHRALGASGFPRRSRSTTTRRRRAGR